MVATFVGLWWFGLVVPFLVWCLYSGGVSGLGLISVSCLECFGGFFGVLVLSVLIGGCGLGGVASLSLFDCVLLVCGCCFVVG